MLLLDSSERVRRVSGLLQDDKVLLKMAPTARKAGSMPYKALFMPVIIKQPTSPKIGVALNDPRRGAR
jgi:hypothetical protein